MDTLSTNKLDTKKQNPVSKHPILITLMRRVLSIVRKILKICLFFLFLLLIRKPVIVITNFIAGASLLMLFFLFWGYISGTSFYGHQTEMVISYTVMMFLFLAVNWGYDALLLRLAPPDYDLMLFK